MRRSPPQCFSCSQHLTGDFVPMTYLPRCGCTSFICHMHVLEIWCSLLFKIIVCPIQSIRVPSSVGLGCRLLLFPWVTQPSPASAYCSVKWGSAVRPTGFADSWPLFLRLGLTVRNTRNCSHSFFQHHRKTFSGNHLSESPTAQ